MNFASFLEKYGDAQVLAIGGALVGLGFGFFAQRSRFCLRAAVIEFWHGQFGAKLSVWLLAFSAAVVTVQCLLLVHVLDISTARQIATRGSLSGALIGGLLFGVGMVLARGCAVGAGMTGGAIFALTAWLTLMGMWAGAGLTDRLLDPLKPASPGSQEHTPSTLTT